MEASSGNLHRRSKEQESIYFAAGREGFEDYIRSRAVQRPAKGVLTDLIFGRPIPDLEAPILTHQSRYSQHVSPAEVFQGGAPAW